MPSAAVILSTSLGIVTLSAIACSISFASAQQLPAATTPPAPTSAAQTQQPHPTPAGQVIITQCPAAPTNFLANNWSDNSSTDTLSVRFASEAVARAPVVWFRLADALCVPHDALLIAAVRPAEAAGELRVDCARAPPTAECDVRARVAYALYLDAERPAALRAIGVESLAPVAVAPPTDAPSPGFAAASTRAPAGADASHPHESSGDDTALLVVFAAVCVLVVAVAAALVVCAVWTFQGHFARSTLGGHSAAHQGVYGQSAEGKNASASASDDGNGFDLTLVEPVVILSTPQPAPGLQPLGTPPLNGASAGHLSPLTLGSGLTPLNSVGGAHDIFGFPTAHADAPCAHDAASD